MIYDDLHRKHLIKELEAIHAKLSAITVGYEGSGALRDELTALAWRIERLAEELKSVDEDAGGSPEPNVILVVDDNDELRNFIKHALELSDYTVLEASDGKSALAVLEKATAIDLILCDVILPVMKGPEIVKAVRKKFPEAKVIFMSGYIVEGIVSQEVEQIVSSGQNFLTKPFPTRKMLETIQEVLEA